jgi:hypothetical protein
MSFLNSFQIVDTDKYWAAKLEASDSPIIFSKVSNTDINKENTDIRYCMQIGSSGAIGFYRGPFFRDDGALFVAFDNLVHPDSLHYRDVMLLNKDSYSYTPNSEGQIYFVPAKKLPEGKYTIKFGYTLQQDSVKECYEFYHEALEVSPHL